MQTAKTTRLSPSDPPEVLAGVLDGMARYSAEVDARRAAKGLPPMRRLTAEESAAVRSAFLGSMFRARFRGTSRAR